MYALITKAGQRARIAPAFLAHYEALGWTRAEGVTRPTDGLSVKGLRALAQEQGIALNSVEMPVSGSAARTRTKAARVEVVWRNAAAEGD